MRFKSAITCIRARPVHYIPARDSLRPDPPPLQLASQRRPAGQEASGRIGGGSVGAGRDKDKQLQVSEQKRLSDIRLQREEWDRVGGGGRGERIMNGGC